MQTFADLGIQIPSGARGEVRTHCPWCTPARKHKNEKDLAVNVDDGVYHCHHCGEHGTIKTGNRDNRQPPPKAYERPKPIPAAPASLHEKMLDWFASRGIGQRVIERNRITTTVRYCGPCQREVPVVAFPYYRDGEHINTTYRCYEKHFSQEKDAERIFYGLDDLAPEAKHITICEGQLDKLAFEQAGVANVLSVPDGAPNPNAGNYAAKFAYLESATDLFARFERVYLAADNDPNGRALNEELGRRIGRERCQVVQWPDTIKDANDALLLIGEPMLQEAIETAKPYPVEGIIYGDDIWPEVDALYQHGYDRGLKIGLAALDAHYRVRAGLMTVVTGHSSHGKSLWLDHIIVRLAMRHDWRFGIFSPENQPVQRHWTNLVEIYLGKPFDAGFTTRMTRDELIAAKPWMNDHFMFVLPDEPHIDAILERAQILLFQKGIRGLVIDPWNEIEHARPAHKSETEYVSEVLGKVRRFARTNDIHIWVMAHPTKYSRLAAKEEAPTMNDIAGSVHFRNKADYGISIWRDPMDPSVGSQCHIQKVRFSETGMPGMVSFRYVGRRMEEA